MAMGKRKKRRQGTLWVETGQLARGPGHPFYRRLNQVLEAEGFDEQVERLCARFYAGQLGRPSLPPAVYFRLLLDRLLRRHRLGARDRLAGGGLVDPAGVSRLRVERRYAGSLDDLAQPAAD